MPPTTAEQRRIEVGDVVVAYIAEGFSDYRVTAIENTNNGDVAALISHDNHIFQQIPLALLYKAESFIDLDRELQIGDAVFVSRDAPIISRVSNIEENQIEVEYISWDKREEKIPRSVIFHFPQKGYLFRKVLYRHNGDIEVGRAVVESEDKIWIDTPNPSLGVIMLNKADTKILKLPDADLGAQKVWTNNYGYRREVQILRVIEPGLLYEIDEQNFEGEYKLLYFTEISLEKPDFDSIE